MDDPEARVKSSLPDCTWLEDVSMDLSPRHWRTYEATRTEEHLLYFFTFILFSSHFLSFIFSFALQNFLQYNTYIAFVRDDVMTPPPCLNDARPRA
jgi:hypothetical protein